MTNEEQVCEKLAKCWKKNGGTILPQSSEEAKERAGECIRVICNMRGYSFVDDQFVAILADQLASAGLLAVARPENDDEKRHRVYYQNIVYDVCRELDGASGTTLGHGSIVCGTADAPTTQVQNAIHDLIERKAGVPPEPKVLTDDEILDIRDGYCRRNGTSINQDYIESVRACISKSYPCCAAIEAERDRLHTNYAQLTSDNAIVIAERDKLKADLATATMLAEEAEAKKKTGYANANRLLAAKDNEIAHLNAEAIMQATALQGKDDAISELEGTLRARDAEIGSLSEQISSLIETHSKENAQWADDLACVARKKDAEIAKLRNFCNAVCSSISENAGNPQNPFAYLYINQSKWDKIKATVGGEYTGKQNKPFSVESQDGSPSTPDTKRKWLRARDIIEKWNDLTRLKEPHPEIELVRWAEDIQNPGCDEMKEKLLNANVRIRELEAAQPMPSDKDKDEALRALDDLCRVCDDRNLDYSKQYAVVKSFIEADRGMVGPTAEEVWQECYKQSQKHGYLSGVLPFCEWYNSQIAPRESVEKPLRDEIANMESEKSLRAEFEQRITELIQEFQTKSGFVVSTIEFCDDNCKVDINVDTNLRVD
jgi:hypothetical protein